MQAQSSHSDLNKTDGNSSSFDHYYDNKQEDSLFQPSTMSNPHMISIKTKTTTAGGATAHHLHQNPHHKNHRKMKPKGKKRALRKPSVRPADEDATESDSKVSEL